MKMAQPMQRGTLTNPGLNRQNFGQGLKIGVLQLQVLTSASARPGVELPARVQA